MLGGEVCLFVVDRPYCPLLFVSGIAYMQAVNGDMHGCFESLKVCARVLMRFPGICRYRFECAFCLKYGHAPTAFAVAWKSTLDSACCTERYVRVAPDFVPIGEFRLEFVVSHSRWRICIPSQCLLLPWKQRIPFRALRIIPREIQPPTYLLFAPLALTSVQ